MNQQPISTRAAWTMSVLGVAAVIAMVFSPAVPQPSGYLDFADTRDLLGMPHFWNVVSNLPLLGVGAWGLHVVARADARTFVEPGEKPPYAFCFAAVALAGVGSSYFHLAPDAGRLMWDRLPIALGFMALLSAVIAERVSVQAGLRALAPLLVAGAASVLYWRWSMLRGAENILPYAVVQFGALAAIVVLAALRSRYTRGADLFIVAAIYAAAKLTEVLDQPIYALGGLLSGHTMKHLLAALAVWWLVRMLQRRLPLTPPSSGHPIR
jgi:hypothetical protein